MSDIRLNLLKNDVAYPFIFADVANFKKIDSKKILDFMEWVADRRINSTPLTDEDYGKVAKKFGLDRGGDIYSADRFLGLVLFDGCELTTIELESDFRKLGFDQKIIDLLLPALEQIWTKLDPLLKRYRLEALPTLHSLRWRVDVRYASSNYLARPEAIAILRIGTSDREKKNHVHIELDLKKLSWLESIVVQLKNELLKAEERIKAGNASIAT